MRLLVSFLFTALLLCACASQTHKSSHTALCKAAFLKLVTIGEINSVNGLAIAPDYAAIYYTSWYDKNAGITVRDCQAGIWSTPSRWNPTDIYQDYQPTLSADGERLYFTSTRPIEGDAPVRQNVWSAHRNGNWTRLTPILALVSPEWDGHAVEVAADVLLFASGRAGETRMVDIFSVDMAVAQPRIIAVDTLNTAISDNDLAYDAVSRRLVFSRYDPETSNIDLFISEQTDSGWREPVALHSLNSEEWEMSPAFTPDGEYFLYKRGDGPFRMIAASDL